MAAWEDVTAQLRELTTATTADDVADILSWERNPFGGDADSDGFFAGYQGRMATVWDALRKAEWRTVWSGGENQYVMRSPDRTTYITYQDGHIYKGDRRPQESR